MWTSRSTPATAEERRDASRVAHGHPAETVHGARHQISSLEGTADIFNVIAHAMEIVKAGGDPAIFAEALEAELDALGMLSEDSDPECFSEVPDQMIIPFGIEEDWACDEAQGGGI